MTATTDLFDLTGKTAVVTGGCGVLCFAIAEFLAQNGANVVLLDRERERGQQCAEEIGERAYAIYADVLDPDVLAGAAAEIEDLFGPADILVNCAGGNREDATTDATRSFFDLPPDALRFVLDLNFMGTLLPAQVFGRQMAAQGQGVILNVSSMSAIRPLTRVVGYSAAKAAVTNFTQWLAVHVAQECGPGLRVNAIAPGFFIGEQNRDFLLNPDDTLTARGQAIIDHTPMRRFGEPEELVGAAVWLASDAARFVTGIVVPVDGGFFAYGGV